jgi:cytochrome c oxidase assembly protein subunit 15
VVGGITVWTSLHPASVAAHFLLSMVMVFITVALYVRCQEPAGRPQVSVGPMLHALSVGLVVVGFVLLVAGTVVTGTGPHGGDAAAPRWGFDLEAVTRLHSALAWLTLAGALLATVIAFRGGARRPVRMSSLLLLVTVVLQGVLGYVQYALELPEALVVLHVLGSALTWVAICRLYFSTTRLVPPGQELSEDPADRDGERSPVGPVPGR